MRSLDISSSDAFICVLKHYKLYQNEELYKVVCPFHGDKNPSMQINIKQAYFYCYGCEAHGSTFELVKNFHPEMSSLQIYSQINKILSGEGGYKGVGVSNVKVVEKINTKLSYVEGIRLARDYYYNLPETNWFKVEEEVLQIKRYMLKRGFSTTTLKKIDAKATYNVNYPIVFPILDNGIFRGYVMRTDNPYVEDQRKYMYNSGFKRKLTLAGNYEKEKPVLIVEGFLDRLAAEQLGVKNVVAILGWKISSEQIEKLKRKKITTIYCGLDNDEAGRKGYLYLQRIAKINGFEIKRIRYPKGIKDFGDLLNNSDASKKVLKQLKK